MPWASCNEPHSCLRMWTTRTGGKGYAGVMKREPSYVNPILDVLESAK